jgi:hypothetical protein
VFFVVLIKKMRTLDKKSCFPGFNGTRPGISPNAS